MTEAMLLRRVRPWLAVFMAGMVISGLTAFPLPTEAALLVQASDRIGFLQGSEISVWLRTVQYALDQTGAKYPFLAYGTDWLAFAHLVIAVAFIGAWRDPVRNRWLFTFGLIACAGVLPLALVAGDIRGIPPFWRLIDCSFGIFGAIPLWICRQLVVRLDRCDLRLGLVRARGRSQEQCYASDYWLD